MFGIIEGLAKAVVGVVTLPVAIVEDVVTLGGAITDKDEPATVTALKRVKDNIESATKPDRK